MATSSKSWAEFVRIYAKQVRGFAAQTLRRWSVPIAVGAEDIEQETWTAAWVAWEAWRPGRGEMSRDAFAYVTGRHAAHRWLHGQRNALRRDGRAPSRFPVAEVTLARETAAGADVGPVSLESAARGIDPGQVTAIEFIEAVRDALRACTGGERRALEALIDSGFDEEWAIASTRRPRDVREAMRKVMQ